ncbi:hypothetical protein [Streptomyces sp. NPDC058953]|uniref:hypothetical protein n=1 Tax=unclassified Streptomyces TaxID=2593676 RepID=UPI0036AB452F
MGQHWSSITDLYTLDRPVRVQQFLAGEEEQTIIPGKQHIIRRRIGGHDILTGP